MKAFTKVAFGGVSPVLAVARGALGAGADGFAGARSPVLRAAGLADPGAGHHGARAAGADGSAGGRSPALRAGALAEPGAGHHGARAASGLQPPRGLVQGGSRPDVPTGVTAASDLADLDATTAAPVASDRDAATTLPASPLHAATTLPASPLHAATTLPASPLHAATTLPASPLHAATTPPAAEVSRSPELPMRASGRASATDGTAGSARAASPEGWQKPAGEADRSVSHPLSPLFSSRSLARGEA